MKHLSKDALRVSRSISRVYKRIVNSPAIVLPCPSEEMRISEFRKKYNLIEFVL